MESEKVIKKRKPKICDICGVNVFEKVSEHYEDPFKVTKIKCLAGHEDTIMQFLPSQTA